MPKDFWEDWIPLQKLGEVIHFPARKGEGVVTKGGPTGPVVHPIKCSHVRQRIKMGKYEITASGSMDVGMHVPRPYPDLGVYLAQSWEYKLIDGDSDIMNYGVKDFSIGKPEFLYPFLLVDWPDGGTISTQLLDQLVVFIIDKMQHGKKVDIGCMGGHGRTGTLLACVLGSIEDMGVSGSVNKLRRIYCSQAVETVAQVKLVQTYLGDDEGQTLPGPSHTSVLCGGQPQVVTDFNFDENGGFGF